MVRRLRIEWIEEAEPVTVTRPEHGVLVVADDKGVRTVVAWQLEAPR